MKVLLILEENSWKTETKLFPLFAISHENYSLKYFVSYFRLSRICRIQWWCSDFVFFANLVQKIKIVSLSWSWVAGIILICRMVVFTFSVLYWKHPFWQMKVREEQLLSLWPYGSKDFEIGRTAFLFCCRECVSAYGPWIVFVHCLKSV